MTALKSIRIILTIMAVLKLSVGCTAIRESTSIREAVAQKGLSITRTLPKKLPGKTTQVPDGQYILVNSDSGIMLLADLANPIPFVNELAVEKWNQYKAGQFKEHITRVDPYQIAIERMTGSPLLSKGPGSIPLMPMVYMMESDDHNYRLSLVFRVEDETWMGRYLYHMPTTYKLAQMQSDDPLVMENLRKEIEAGSDRLRSLMERDARGDLKGNGTKVDIGSYHLVGASLLGFIPAHFLTYKDADLLEEGSDYVVVRSRGDLEAAGNSGALVFGVHYFRKDQLHTFTKKDAKP